MNKATARQHGMKNGKQAARVMLMEHTFSSRDEAMTSIMVAEQMSRQFSPFDQLANRINSESPSWRRDELWGMYDIGVTKGIEEILADVDFDEHDCTEYAVKGHSEMGTFWRCDKCNRVLSASVERVMS